MKKLLGLFGSAGLLLMAGCAHHPHQYHQSGHHNRTGHYNQVRHHQHDHTHSYHCEHEHAHSQSGYLVPNTRNIQH